MMPKLLHSVKVDGESVKAGTKVKYIGPAPKAGKHPRHREQVAIRLPDGREVSVDASAIDAHSF
jgi:hypothetical protein